MPNALIVGDRCVLLDTLATQIRTHSDWNAEILSGRDEAFGRLSGNGIDAIFVDLRSDQSLAPELLRFADRGEGCVHVVAISDRGYPRALWDVVEGVAGHLALPADPAVLATSLPVKTNGNGKRKRTHGESRTLQANGLSFTTRTPALFPILEQLERVAKHDVTLLFLGETGTGKSHLARLVHELSDRQRGPFFATACGALPRDLIESELFGHVRGAFTTAVRSAEGRFEAARGGSLLLDEIDVLGPKEQSKLLSVIETGRYEPVGSTDTKVADVRLIVASNENLEELVERSLFRSDLFYRLSVLEFHLPPLRERPDDIFPLATMFIDATASKHNIAITHLEAGFLERLKSYHWPGNIRQLLNQMCRAVLLSRDGVIRVESLALDHNPSRRLQNARVLEPMRPNEWNLDSRLAHSERTFLQETLRAHNNNRAATARASGISRTALYKKLRRLGLVSADTERPPRGFSPAEAEAPLGAAVTD